MSAFEQRIDSIDRRPVAAAMLVAPAGKVSWLEWTLIPMPRMTCSMAFAVSLL